MITTSVINRDANFLQLRSSVGWLDTPDATGTLQVGQVRTNVVKARG